MIPVSWGGGVGVCFSFIGGEGGGREIGVDPCQLGRGGLVFVLVLLEGRGGGERDRG